MVHEALDKISECRSIEESFTPKTTVGTLLSALGAEIITCLAPAFKCRLAPSFDVNLPVDSITRSIFNSFHGKADGSVSDSTFILRLFI